MKLENERFLIVKKTKKFILNLDKIVSFFPNRDHVGKNKIVEDSFLLLESIYLINTRKQTTDIKNLQSMVMTKINMLDFYLERAYMLHYISEGQCLKLSDELLEINKMFVSWMVNIDNGEIVSI